MFQPLELYVNQTIDLDSILKTLDAFQYKRVHKTFQEGEFALRGGILDLYPLNFDSPIRIDFEGEGIRSIASVNIKTGKSIWQHKIIIVLPNKPSPKSVFTADIPLNNFVNIERGDYVVHNYHGVGRFLGIEELHVNNQKENHLVIEYAGGDKLFVPNHAMHLVQKYVSFQKKPPRLYKLGTKEWQRVRVHVQKRLQRLAAELLHIQALRTSLPGYAFSKDVEWQKEFEKNFPFEDTPDQMKAVEEVKKDMESPFPMDRLLCGDVGYGKTEVAMRAAFKAVMDNRQAVILVPTTILAEQHYYNFSNRLKNFPVNIAMLSRFRSAHEQKKIIQNLKKGQVDIVIGTHRLLSKDIAFKDLGLIIIDEEQRFGVKAKERLKQLRLLADVLTLTATPIPRTLYMALAGAKDMSVISTPPQNRIPVETIIIQFDEDLIKEAVERELKRGGQIFFLHNRVEDIKKIAKIIERLIQNIRLAVAHGQMAPRQLEEIMLQFLKKEIDVLVCTSIIESGIDIPNANTIIVNRADQFGLADLHQLRGRVGRFNQQAYAYFIVPPEKALTGQAKARLEALGKHTQLGAGFQIAFEDLQIRGAGNLLGQEQHGCINTIGFDLYCRLLKEAIEHLRKEREMTKHHGSLN